MDLNSLTAISPIDGRYRNKVESLDAYFSEYALIKYRMFVEVEYFIALCELPLQQLKDFPDEGFHILREMVEAFTPEKAEGVKKIEAVTNHDVKAVEYYLKQQFNLLGFSAFREFVHFGLTSQDVNNTAVPLSLKDAVRNAYMPLLEKLVNRLNTLSRDWVHIPMLARTHGQPASPTRLGKEFRVFAERLEIQTEELSRIPYSAKFGGATGNFNAHHAAYPGIDWVAFGNDLVNKRLGLKRSQTTTQIDHYDQLAAIFDAMRRINVILIDLARDVWSYISMDYFKQKIKEGETGSSAMPHKVNPIDFENAEGNLGVANAVGNHLAGKLPVSRLQRDLTDSTVVRNVGVPLAHSMIAFRSLLKGLGKLVVHEENIRTDLDEHWVVVSEAIQTVMRREGIENPFETLKQLTRTNEPVNKKKLHDFIDSLDLKPAVKEELKRITPFNYTGI